MLKPERLRPGDKVAIVSLSRGMLGEKPFLHKYHLGKERLERDYGLRVVAMPNALKGIDCLYRHPEARAQDLMDAFRDPSIKAVFNAIGGDDTIRLLPCIDFRVLRNNPKIFTGFSDTTTNHFMLHKAGVPTLSYLCPAAAPSSPRRTGGPSRPDSRRSAQMPSSSSWTAATMSTTLNMSASRRKSWTF